MNTQIILVKSPKKQAHTHIHPRRTRSAPIRLQIQLRGKTHLETQGNNRNFNTNQSTSEHEHVTDETDERQSTEVLLRGKECGSIVRSNVLIKVTSMLIIQTVMILLTLGYLAVYCL